jgi:MOSC domain-containing protein
VTAENQAVGTVVSLWRYPVKSMQGQELNASVVTERGLLGDRALAMIDATEGKVVSAKNPRKWPDLFSFRAAFTGPPLPDRPLPPVRITLPNGTTLSSEQADRDTRLSTALGRAVSLHGTAPETPVLEEYWPDLDGLPHRDAVTDERIPKGSFFDLATVHLLTTATLDRLRELYPHGRFEARRFRPNIVVDCGPDETGFVEQAWVGRTLTLGEVRLHITGPCPRCVMTTLAQADLPRDPGILRAAVQNAGGNVGVYASVIQGGTVRRGESLRVE